MKKIELKRFFLKYFFKASLLPLLVIEIALIVIYFSVTSYNQKIAMETLENESLSYLRYVAGAQTQKIKEQLVAVSDLATLLRIETERIFVHPEMFLYPSSFKNYFFSDKGVFFKKINDTNCSLFFSNRKKIGTLEKDKAIRTEALDPIYNSVLASNSIVIAVYLNTFDSMNRYCPFIEKIYDQYPPDINIPDYNFYYLADDEHNHERAVVWTDAYLDPAGQGWMVSCIVPVYNVNFLEGVVGLDITIGQFADYVLNLDLPWKSNAFIVDSKGTILAMQEKVERLLGLRELREHVYTGVVQGDTFKPERFNILKSKNESIQEAAMALLEGKTPQMELSIGAREFIITQANVPETGWKIMLLTDKEEIFQPVWKVRKQSREIGFLAIGGMVCFYFGFFIFLFKKAYKVANHISAPVLRISDASRKISESEYDLVLDKTDILELDDLSENFKNMASKLKEFHHFLHEEKLNAEAACRAKNEFLDNVGHELRTPLNAVIGFSGLLQDQTLGNLSPDQADYVEYILKEAHKLLSLINDIISYSKLEDGEGILDNVAFSLREQLSDIVSIIRKRAQKKGLTVEFFINEDVPDIVLGDEKKYRQVVWHLLSNAVKFSEKGAVEVQVEMGAPGENHSFELFTSVVDTGVGIPEDKLPFIFDVFTQVDGSNTRKYGGTGLGLAICRKLVHIMGGQITVRSEMGAGSQFNFSVRLKKVA